MTNKLLISLLLCSLSFPAWAGIEPEKFTLSPMIGGHIFEGNQSLATALHLGLGLGYNFTKKWALEAVFTTASADAEDSSTSDTDVRTYRIDALYHLMPDQKLVPYLAAGLGGISSDPDLGSSKNHLLFNYGVGLKYFFKDGLFALRADVRHLLDLPDPDNNLQYSIGLIFPFGHKTAAMAPAPAVPTQKVVEKPVMKPAPVPLPQPVDSDSDGVVDSMDSCSNTPLGVGVDARGCPLDTDKDGVFDHLDKCLATPYGVSVDTNGCPTSLTLHINFGTNSSQIGPEYDTEIAKAAECINEFPGNIVFIDGHTDNAGDSAYNQKLSEQRAAAVMRRLIERFNIKESRLTSRGFGESKPIASNATPEGKSQNRRVEVGCGEK